MFFVYLFAAVIGLGLLGVSLVAGHGHSGVDLNGDGIPDADTGASESSAGLFSVRALTYMLGFGGLTGMLGKALAHVNEPWNAIVAAVTGVCAALIAQTLLRKLTDNGQNATRSMTSVVGKTALVLVAPTKNSAGKVRIQDEGRTLDLLASCDDETVRVRDEVLIVSLGADGGVVISRNPIRMRADPRAETDDDFDHALEDAQQAMQKQKQAR